jgi:hypothetical protein
MKKILFTLCFASVVSGVRGQIYIDSYRFGAAAVNNLLLDSFSTAAAAYSFRKLDKDYAGNCIEVRNATTSRTFTIGFDGEYLDTFRLKDSCVSADCFVRTWYDQSGNNRNFEQTTTANQPKITTSGVLERNGGEVCAVFDGSNDELQVPSSTAMFNFLHNGDNSAVTGVLGIGTSANPAFERTIFSTGGASATVGVFGYYDDTPDNDRLYLQINRGVDAVLTALGASPNNAFPPQSQNIFIYLIDAGNATAANRIAISVNNGSEGKTNNLTNAPSTANATNNLSIPGTLFGATPCKYQEIIFWSTDQNSNITAIRDNINRFYSIY